MKIQVGRNLIVEMPQQGEKLRVSVFPLGLHRYAHAADLAAIRRTMPPIHAFDVVRATD